MIENTTISEFMVNGCRVVNAKIALASFDKKPDWYETINQVSNPTGPMAGKGCFLLQREDYDAATFDDPFSIRIVRKSDINPEQTIELRGYVAVKAYAAIQLPGTPMVVEVADIRHLLNHRFVDQDFDADTPRTEVAAAINTLLDTHGSITVEDGANRLGELRYHGMPAMMAAWDLATRSNRYIAFDQATGQIKTIGHTGEPTTIDERVHKRYLLPDKLEAMQVGEVINLFDTEDTELLQVQIVLENPGDIGETSWGTHVEQAPATLEANDMQAIWSAWATVDESKNEYVGAYPVEHGPDVSCVTHKVYSHEAFTIVETGKHYPPFLPRQRVGDGNPTNPTDSEDPANNNDCCEFGQLFICPLPEGIDYRVLCSAIDPPIDGEKMHKVRFFAVDANGNEIESEDDNVILEHKELLTLPCTEEVCKNVDLSSVELGGVSIGIVTYGNHNGCCGGILFLQTATYVGALGLHQWVTGQTSLQRTISRPDANPPHNITISTEVNLPIVLREEDLSTFLEEEFIPYSIVTTLIESDIEITSFGSGSTGGVFGNPNVIVDGPSTSQGPVFQNTVTGSFTVREDSTGEGSGGGADFFIQSGNSVTTSNNQIITLGGVAIRYVRPVAP